MSILYEVNRWVAMWFGLAITPRKVGSLTFCLIRLIKGCAQHTRLPSGVRTDNGNVVGRKERLRERQEGKKEDHRGQEKLLERERG